MTNTETAKPVRTRTRRFLRWIKYLAIGLVSVVLLLACVGAIYEAIESHRDRSRYHPPGQLVDVGGFRLHLYCVGQGSPTVLLEAGGGNPWLAWYKVQPQVAKFTRVCSYDRAGMGWSDPSPRPRTTKTIAAELHTLLQNAEVAGPYVVVGHSLGGMDVRMFASQYPNEVVGMVLVDSSHPDQEDRFPPEAKKLSARSRQVVGIMQFLLPFGVPRLLTARSVPPEVRGEFCGVFCRRQFLAGVAAEIAAMEGNNAEVRTVAPLGDLPLAVLSHDPDKMQLPGGLTEGVNRAWEAMQQELAHLSSRGSYLVVKGSGHDIQIQKPEAVIDAIRTVIEQGRTTNKTGSATT